MRGKYKLRKGRSRVGADEKANSDASVLVAVALISERYGIMRKEVDDIKQYVEAARAEKAWYKAYAAGVIGVCTLVVTGVSWASSNQVLAKVQELVNQSRTSAAIVGPQTMPAAGGH